MVQLLYFNVTSDDVYRSLAAFGIDPTPKYGYNKLFF